MKLRQQRLGDEIRDLLANCFLGDQMQDPRLEQVTITAVKLTPDLQLASVYFRVYEDSKITGAEAGLRAAAGYLRNQLAGVLDVRRVPQLRFFYDESIERANNIESILRKINRA